MVVAIKPARDQRKWANSGIFLIHWQSTRVQRVRDEKRRKSGRESILQWFRSVRGAILTHGIEREFHGPFDFWINWRLK